MRGCAADVSHGGSALAGDTGGPDAGEFHCVGWPVLTVHASVGALSAGAEPSCQCGPGPWVDSSFTVRTVPAGSDDLQPAIVDPMPRTPRDSSDPEAATVAVTRGLALSLSIVITFGRGVASGSMG